MAAPHFLRQPVGPEPLIGASSGKLIDDAVTSLEAQLTDDQVPCTRKVQGPNPYSRAGLNSK
jgi:hypothetical protein